MTKEELKQEAEVCMHNALYWLKLPISKENVEQGGSYILKLLEPREKEIKSLGERCLQLQKDKGNLTDSVRDLEEKLANADYQLEGRDLEIKELKAQIEKMKSDVLNLIKGRMNEDIDQNLIERMADKWGLKYE